MNIIVCIKQVPATTDVKINPEDNTLIRNNVEAVVNPFDVYAIEEAVRLKERIGGKVIVLTMGPPQAEAILREGISFGADEGVLVSDRVFAGADTLATSYALSKAIEKIGEYDVILCGKQAIDGDTAQVGPGIAEKLDIPHVAYVKKVEDIKENFIKVERLMEDGYDVIESGMPILLTVVKEINEPRIPSLKGKMRAKKAEIRTFSAEDIGADPEKIGLKGSPTWVSKIFSPPSKEGGELMVGSYEEIAEKLIGKLREHKIV
ncbi:electron transfer flavoprotein subunit beta/FixA family protein [bacterium]